MKYEMRALKTSDIFAMSRILKKLELDLKIDISKFKGKELTAEDAGKEAFIQLLKTALENLHQAEKEVNGFLGSLVGLNEKKFGELPIEDTFEIIAQFKGQKGLANFLKLAGI